MQILRKYFPNVKLKMQGFGGVIFQIIMQILIAQRPQLSSILELKIFSDAGKSLTCAPKGAMSLLGSRSQSTVLALAPYLLRAFALYLNAVLDITQ